MYAWHDKCATQYWSRLCFLANLKLVHEDENLKRFVDSTTGRGTFKGPHDGSGKIPAVIADRLVREGVTMNNAFDYFEAVANYHLAHPTPQIADAQRKLGTIIGSQYLFLCDDLDLEPETDLTRRIRARVISHGDVIISDVAKDAVDAEPVKEINSKYQCMYRKEDAHTVNETGLVEGDIWWRHFPDGCHSCQAEQVEGCINEESVGKWESVSVKQLALPPVLVLSDRDALSFKDLYPKVKMFL